MALRPARNIFTGSMIRANCQILRRDFNRRECTARRSS
jgi:hypothetical protein